MTADLYQEKGQQHNDEQSRFIPQVAVRAQCFVNFRKCKYSAGIVRVGARSQFLHIAKCFCCSLMSCLLVKVLASQYPCFLTCLSKTVGQVK